MSVYRPTTSIYDVGHRETKSLKVLDLKWHALDISSNDPPLITTIEVTTEREREFVCVF